MKKVPNTPKTYVPKSLRKFYKANPGFDVLSVNLLNKEETVPLKLDSATHRELRTWQRLARISPGSETAQMLFDEGIGSAQQVTAMSQTTFIRTYSSRLGDGNKGYETAKDIYKRALQVKDQTMHMLANVYGVVASRYYPAMPVYHIDAGVTDYFESLSDYQQIFGSLDFCSCDECKSIFGAAAYFVDLMRIIDKAITVPNSKSSDPIPAGLTLKDRRPDLWQIELTCSNTTTMVPYLQIVNEILENTVVNALIAEQPGTNPSVWPAMAQSVYPFNTPYNQPLSQIRILLQQFNITLSSVIGAFDPRHASPVGWAVETASLNYESYQLVKTPATSAAALSAAYGTAVGETDNGGLDHLKFMLAQTGLDRSTFQSLLRQNLSQKERDGVAYTYTPTLFGTQLVLVFFGDNVTGTFDDHYGTLQGTLKDNIVTGTWSMASQDPPDNLGAFQFTFVADLSSFTGKWMKGYNSQWETTPWNGQQTGVALSMTLAHQLFINQGETGNMFMDISVNNSDPLAPFEQITNLNHDSLDRINRFIRLAASIGWSYETLDWMMTSLGYTEITEACILSLADVKTLADRFNIPPMMLSACWFDIKTTGMGDANNSQALFDIIFNNPALIRDGEDLDYYHPRTITAAGADKNALFNNPSYFNAPVDWIISPAMHATEPKPAAGIDPSSFTYGRRILSGIEATNDDLIAIASFFFPGQSAISLGVSNLSLLYRHALLPAQMGLPVKDYLVLLGLIGEQNDGLLSMADIKRIADVDGWIKKAGFNVYELDFILNGNVSLYVNTGYTQESLMTFLASIMLSLDAQLVVKSGFKSNAITIEVSEAFYNYFLANAFIDANGVVLKKLDDAEKARITQLTLPDGTTIIPSADQLNDAQKKINQEYDSQQALIVGGLSGFFNADSALATIEINGIAGIQKIASVVAMFVDDNGKGGEVMQLFILVFSQHLLMAKRLFLTADELHNIYLYPEAYLSGNGDVFNFTPLLLSNVENIWKMKGLVYTFQDTKNRFITFLALASKGEVTKEEMQKLCELTGWNGEQCDFVCGILFGTDKMCKTVRQIYEVNNCFELGKQVGVDMYLLKSLQELQLLPATPANWLTFTDRANALTGALRAYFGNEAWDSVFKKYNGPLLEQQRDVLEAFCLWKLGGKNGKYQDITTSRNLYEFLLIDVDMSGCNDVSYIRQALNSAQLYLQRCHLNLERNVSISTDDIPNSWWSWLMSYRIWEANRQVFLYPENYLDPTLRKTKTSLFKELENDLSQEEVTKSRVDRAYKKYLDSFSDLAKLQYVDACQFTVHDPNLGAADTLFLFARTQTDPAGFYYISRQSGSVWSEWKPINITIPSEYITSVYVFNRLFIFWVELSSSQDADPTTQTANAKCNIVKASIKYSFIDFSGDWTQPQSLIDNKVINVDTAVSLYKPFSAKMFASDRPYWHKVSAIPVNTNNFTDALTGRLCGEKLVISYGPFLSVTATSGELMASPYVSYNNPSIRSFEDSITNAVLEHNQEYRAGKSVEVPLNHALVIDEMLNPSWLINQSEFVYYANDAFGPDTAPAFQAAFDTVSGSLVLLPDNNTIATNYTEGMNLEPLAAMPPSVADKNSFVWKEGGIDSPTSENYFNLLKTAKVINADGSVTSNIANYSEDMIESILFIDDKTKCRYVRNVLFQLYYGSPVLMGSPQGSGIGIVPVRNAPCSFLFVHPSGTFLIEIKDKIPEITNALQIATGFGWVDNIAFINSGLAIDADLSNDICVGLQAPGLKAMDAYGIVRLAFCKTLTPDMISGVLQINDLQAQWVLNVLVSSGRTGMQYVTNTSDIDLNLYDITFNSTRLTTGAIQDLSKRLFAQGIDGVLQLSAQQAPVNAGHCFGDFNPGTQLGSPEAFYDSQVAFSGPYGYYYWELFYYAPTMVASLLKNNKQFSDSQQWYQYIFNPTIPPYYVNPDSFINKDISKALSEQFYTALDSAGYITAGSVTDNGDKASVQEIATVLGLNLNVDPDGKNLRTAREMQNMLRNDYLSNPLGRYWQFNPFRNHTIASLQSDLTNNAQIKIYNDDPFDPDAIARLRIGAYEKNIVMQYIDNLLDWGDMEFTQYTWESITTATMLYVYAYDLLGPRPQDLGACSSEPDATYANIEDHYKGSEIPQFLIDLENSAGMSVSQNVGQPGLAYNDLDVYFCVPDNAQFMGYWDLVEDRLYKIRHCLNINGIAQPLALFDPPIDPMQLVKAAAASNGVLNLQNLLQPAVPYYRFNSMLTRAYSIINSVVQLGNSLLSVLEKNDAEGLALLNSSQQVALLNMMTIMKQQQIEEQTDNIAAMNEALKSAQNRLTYYSNQIRLGINKNENAALLLSAESIVPQLIAQGIRGVSIAGYLAPNIFGFADGGMQFGDAINTGAQLSEGISAMMNQSASVLATMAQYTRRNEEWVLQQQTAQYDVEQITQQLLGAQVQLAYNKQDLAVHGKNIEQVKRVDAFLRTKFTDQELYQWMGGRLSSLYYTTYQLAVNTALSVQTAYQYELDNHNSFISYNYWDSLRKGLLAGEGLMLSVQQMENAYLNKNARRLEIEKTISLKQLFPQEFLKFVWGHDKGQQGVFNFTLGERLFDFDFPGHYNRKIKTISISLPAVIGPYQNLNATLTQNANSVLLKADPAAVNYLIYTTSVNPGGNTPPAPASDILRCNWMPNQQIAVTTGMDDAGLFQLDFNDERYLPFEGTGAVSGWTFSLPPETNRINFGSISDVIVKIRYTAIEGGKKFSSDVKALYTGSYPQFYNLQAKCMDMNQAYADGWFRLFATPPVSNVQSITFRVTDNYLLTNLKNIRLHTVMVQMEAADNAVINAGAGNEFISLTIGTGNPQPIIIDDNFGELALPGETGDDSDVMWSFSFDISKTPPALLTQDLKELDPKKLLNMALIVVYKADAF